MRARYKASVLTEMILVIAIFTMMLIPIAHISQTLIENVPQTYRLYQTNTSLLDAMTQIKLDIAAADSLSLNEQADKLTLKNDKKIISYQLKDDLLIRKMENTAEQWKLNRVVMDMNLSQQNTVEIRTYIAVKKRGRDIKKLETNHLFFTGISKGDVN